MAGPEPFRSPAPVAIADHARDNLRFIRETMERAASFTAVPGWGGVAMGITALGAAAIASRQVSSLPWLLTWIAEAFIAIIIAGWTTYSKARLAGSSLVQRARSALRVQFRAAAFCGRAAHRLAFAFR